MYIHSTVHSVSKMNSTETWIKKKKQQWPKKMKKKLKFCAVSNLNENYESEFKTLIQKTTKYCDEWQKKDKKKVENSKPS